MLDRQHLMILREVDRLGSLTAAAERLNVTQSALSHAMRKFEERYGVAVWLREGRALRLTQAGEYLLALAQRVHDEYVRNGQQEADQILEDSRLKGDQIVREANDERRRVLEQLESERADLETRVDDLKAFENDYRQKVREHLQALIGQLDAQEA